MLIVLLEKVPPTLRGQLSRWLLEPKTGVFLGNPSVRVREQLQQKIASQVKDGGALMLWSYPCSQGYRWWTCGLMKRQLDDFEGLALVRLREVGAESG